MDEQPKDGVARAAHQGTESVAEEAIGAAEWIDQTNRFLTTHKLVLTTICTAIAAIFSAGVFVGGAATPWIDRYLAADPNGEAFQARQESDRQLRRQSFMLSQSILRMAGDDRLSDADTQRLLMGLLVQAVGDGSKEQSSLEEELASRFFIVNSTPAPHSTAERGIFFTEDVHVSLACEILTVTRDYQAVKFVAVSEESFSPEFRWAAEIGSTWRRKNLKVSTKRINDLSERCKKASDGTFDELLSTLNR